MASTVVYNEIKGHLQTQFAPMPVLDFDQLEPALEQQQNNFLVLEEVVTFEELIGIGDPQNLCVSENAVFLVHVFVPAPESSAVARALCDQVQASLRFQTLNDVRVNEANPGEPGALNDGLWTSYNTAVSVDYYQHVARP